MNIRVHVEQVHHSDRVMYSDLTHSYLITDFTQPVYKYVPVFKVSFLWEFYIWVMHLEQLCVEGLPTGYV